MNNTITILDLFTISIFLIALIKLVIPNHKALRESLTKLENGEHVR